MEFRYSKELDPAGLDTEALCLNVPFRMHQSPGREDLGAIMAQEDWKEIIGAFVTPKAGLSPKFNFLSVAFPETIPDRLEVLAYFNEYGLLHDDVVESVNQQEGDEQNDEAMHVCERGATGSIENFKNITGRGLMMSKVASKMLSIDPGPASVALSHWAEWFRKGAGRRNHTQFTTLEEYLEYRIFDVGDVYLIGIGIFGMGLNIPEHEMKLLPGLCRQAWIALSLTNDLFSLEKELKAAKENPVADVSNAVVVVMRERGIDQEEAEELCRQLIRQSVAKFLHTVEATKNQEHLSHDLRVLIEAVQYILSGNLAWTRSAPRYNPGVAFSDRQLEWMKYGTPQLVFTA
ncbi:hypothetical protein FANTH_13878 [Fusarium anthophilum]|uniref:Terpene synthase n=1 Tax=Fusarium anthophilum TaxID=48485 RepID=A0A8H4YLE0_9HYPO|nr:hypothetical protein FANTH_13878 [Fusarium anthophilum]